MVPTLSQVLTPGLLVLKVLDSHPFLLTGSILSPINKKEVEKLDKLGSYLTYYGQITLYHSYLEEISQMTTFTIREVFVGVSVWVLQNGRYTRKESGYFNYEFGSVS